MCGFAGEVASVTVHYARPMGERKYKFYIFLPPWSFIAHLYNSSPIATSPHNVKLFPKLNAIVALVNGMKMLLLYSNIGCLKTRPIVLLTQFTYNERQWIAMMFTRWL